MNKQSPVGRTSLAERSPFGVKWRSRTLSKLDSQIFSISRKSADASISKRVTFPFQIDSTADIDGSFRISCVNGRAVKTVISTDMTSATSTDLVAYVGRLSQRSPADMIHRLDVHPSTFDSITNRSRDFSGRANESGTKTRIPTINGTFTGDDLSSAHTCA